MASTGETPGGGCGISPRLIAAEMSGTASDCSICLDCASSSKEVWAWGPGAAAASWFSGSWFSILQRRAVQKSIYQKVQAGQQGNQCICIKGFAKEPEHCAKPFCMQNAGDQATHAWFLGKIANPASSWDDELRSLPPMLLKLFLILQKHAACFALLMFCFPVLLQVYLAEES